MKKKIDYENITPKEMFETQKAKTKPNDTAVRIALMLLLPYVIWLSKYSAEYVKSTQGKLIHLNFDGVMLSFHQLISNANMIVHEAGHGVCYIVHCPQMITVLNGTLFQLALPLIFTYWYHKRKNKILSGLGMIWLAQNLIYVSWYMSYSQTPNLYPFFLGGDNTIHDFWYIFSELGVLEYSTFISGVVRFFANILLYGAYFYLLFISFIQKEHNATQA